MKVSGYVSVDVDGELEVAHDDGVLDGRPRRVHADLQARRVHRPCRWQHVHVCIVYERGH